MIARDKLLEAAAKLIRTNGYSATSVDQLCGEAGATKGAFFHHFASNEALGLTTAPHWSANTGAFFAETPFDGKRMIWGGFTPVMNMKG